VPLFARGWKENSIAHRLIHPQKTQNQEFNLKKYKKANLYTVSTVYRAERGRDVA